MSSRSLSLDQHFVNMHSGQDAGPTCDSVAKPRIWYVLCDNRTTLMRSSCTSGICGNRDIYAYLLAAGRAAECAKAAALSVIAVAWNFTRVDSTQGIQTLLQSGILLIMNDTCILTQRLSSARAHIVSAKKSEVNRGFIPVVTDSRSQTASSDAV